MSFEQKKGERITAEMGNQLRNVVAKDRREFDDRLAEITGSLSQVILSSLAKKDSELLAAVRDKR